MLHDNTALPHTDDSDVASVIILPRKLAMYKR
jgi:hypothetical protein